MRRPSARNPGPLKGISGAGTRKAAVSAVMSPRERPAPQCSAPYRPIRPSTDPRRRRLDHGGGRTTRPGRCRRGRRPARRRSSSPCAGAGAARRCRSTGRTLRRGPAGVTDRAIGAIWGQLENRWGTCSPQALTLHLLDQTKAFNRFADVADPPVHDPGVNPGFLRARRLHVQPTERSYAERIGMRKIQRHRSDPGRGEYQRPSRPSLPRPKPSDSSPKAQGRPAPLPALAHAEVIRCVADAPLIADERTVPRVSIPRGLKSSVAWTATATPPDRDGAPACM